MPDPTLPFAVFVACAILHLFARNDFPRMGLLDDPKRYGHRRAPLPYPTGILAVLTFVAFFSVKAPWTLQSAGILLAVFLLALTCFRDDRLRLPPVLRLAIQATVAFVIFATGSRIYTITNPLEGFFGMGDLLKLDTIDITTFLGPLPLWSGVFTVLWLMLTMNALNWFDGIPGQVSLLSTIGFLVIGMLSVSARVEQPELALIAFILAAVAAACLVFDFPPPKMLLGDTGAMFFGLMLGTLTIMSGGKVATAFLVLGVPLIDVFLVIVRRILKGASPFQGNVSDEHLHHRLLRMGWSERKIIALTALLGTSFGISALFLDTRAKFVAALILLFIMLGLSLYSAPRKSL